MPAKQQEANVRQEPSVAVIDSRPDRDGTQWPQRALPEGEAREAQPRLREVLGMLRTAPKKPLSEEYA
jgi:hypothetical protein